MDNSTMKLKLIGITFFWAFTICAMKPETNVSPYLGLQCQAAIGILDKHIDLSEFDNEDRILDIGSGAGITTCRIAEKTHAYVRGIDESPDVVSSAKKLWARQQNLDFKQDDPRDLKCCEQEEYNLIVSFNTFHWIKEKEKLFASIFRTLKPGGTMLFSACRLDPSFTLATRIAHLSASGSWRHTLPASNILDCWNPLDSTTLKIVEKAGFIIKKKEEITKQLTFNTTNELTLYLKDLLGDLPVFRDLKADTRARFATDLATRYAQNLPTNCEGKLLYRIPSLVVKAAKP
jgi:trans-aconitate methyltransferase